jgi:hypothetical protein
MGSRRNTFDLDGEYAERFLIWRVDLPDRAEKRVPGFPEVAPMVCASSWSSISSNDSPADRPTPNVTVGEIRRSTKYNPYVSIEYPGRDRSRLMWRPGFG